MCVCVCVRMCEKVNESERGVSTHKCHTLVLEMEFNTEQRVDTEMLFWFVSKGTTM